MNRFDVLVIGGYGLLEKGPGETPARDLVRLHSARHHATLGFIGELVNESGNLEAAERNYISKNRSKMVARSLNTIYLYDFLTKNGISTEAVHYFMLEQPKFAELVKCKPKVVVISTTFISDARDVVQIARAVRDASPESVIIVGGTKVLKSFKEFTLCKQDYFEGYDVASFSSTSFFFDSANDQEIDAFVIEESGELTLLELIDAIKEGRSFRNTPNIAFRENDQLAFTRRVKEPYTYGTSQISWDKIPADMIGNEIPVRAGVGCPFKCKFCDFTGLCSRIRLSAVDDLISELELIQSKFPGMPVFFTDDNLFTNKKRTKEFCEAIIRRRLRFPWRAFFRADAVTAENADAIKLAGCHTALLGIESGDNAVLKNMDKRCTREQNLKAVTLLNQSGISTISTLIVGYPGETSESIDNTIDLLNSYPVLNNAINKYFPSVFQYLPLSPIAALSERQAHGMAGGCNKWSHCTMSSCEAERELVRLFRESGGPSLSYHELVEPTLALDTVRRLSVARDNIVKSGTNVITKDNVGSIYKTFKDILAPEGGARHEKPRAVA